MEKLEVNGEAREVNISFERKIEGKFQYFDGNQKRIEDFKVKSYCVIAIKLLTECF